MLAEPRAYIDRILGHEGGLSLDPHDRGNWTGGKCGVGELRGTKYGIACASHPAVDVASLTREQAVDIYRLEYANPLLLAGLPPGVGFQLLDFAVNSGTFAAVRAFQRCVGARPDGVMGPATLGAARLVEPWDLVFLLTAARIDHMTADPAWATQGRGWARRLAGNLRYAAGDVNLEG